MWKGGDLILTGLILMHQGDKMITKKGLIILGLAILCLYGIYFVYPLTEQYQGCTGFIYENGLFFYLLYICLILFSILLFAYVVIDMCEVES